jgi:hypothetical protein
MMDGADKEALFGLAALIIGVFMVCIVAYVAAHFVIKEW